MYNIIIVIHEMSEILNTGLDKETLSTLVSLCENGVNPEALAAIGVYINTLSLSLSLSLSYISHSLSLSLSLSLSFL